MACSLLSRFPKWETDQNLRQSGCHMICKIRERRCRALESIYCLSIIEESPFVLSLRRPEEYWMAHAYFFIPFLETDLTNQFRFHTWCWCVRFRAILFSLHSHNGCAEATTKRLFVLRDRHRWICLSGWHGSCFAIAHRPSIAIYRSVLIGGARSIISQHVMDFTKRKIFDSREAQELHEIL